MQSDVIILAAAISTTGACMPPHNFPFPSRVLAQFSASAQIFCPPVLNGSATFGLDRHKGRVSPATRSFGGIV